MATYTITAIVETSEGEEGLLIVDDAVSQLEIVLPYMFDNVFITSTDDHVG